MIDALRKEQGHSFDPMCRVLGVSKKWLLCLEESQAVSA